MAGRRMNGENRKQMKQLVKNESIVFMIIVYFSFSTYWYLLYSSFIRNIYCNK